MLRMFVEEAAALASITLFVGMIAVWAQLIPAAVKLAGTGPELRQSASAWGKGGWRAQGVCSAWTPLAPRHHHWDASWRVT